MLPCILPHSCRAMLGGRDMKWNGSSCKNTTFHSPLHKAFHVVAQGYFKPEQLCPTLPFLILMLAVINPSPSLEQQGLMFMPKTLPRKEKPILLIVSTEKNMKKTFCFYSAHAKAPSVSATSICFHYLKNLLHMAILLWSHTQTHTAGRSPLSSPQHIFFRNPRCTYWLGICVSVCNNPFKNTNRLKRGYLSVLFYIMLLFKGRHEENTKKCLNTLERFKPSGKHCLHSVPYI